MDQNDSDIFESAWFKAISSQAEKMDTMEMIEKQRRKCTDDFGRFNREEFMFFVGIFIMLISGKDGFFESLKDVNRYLYEILGIGHSFVSCVQFVRGKKGQRILRESVLKLEFRRRAALDALVLSMN